MKKFTLIELLVVVAIIGILLSILLPSLSRSKEIALRAVCMSNQSQTSKKIFLYGNDKNQHIPTYKPNGDSIGEGHNTRYFYSGSRWSSRKNLALLWNSEEEVREEKPEYLFCPAQKNGLFKYETYAPFPKASATQESGWSNRIRLSILYNPWRVSEDSMEPRYRILSDFDEETILLSDIFTQAKEMLMIKDIVSHSSIFSMNFTKGDGSVHVKKSKTLMETIRSGNWETESDLNRMCNLLLN